MRSKDWFWILGGGLLFGAATYFVTKLLLDEKTEGERISNDINQTNNEDPIVEITDITEKVDELGELKVETSNAITERHQAAAEIIRESVENITNDEIVVGGNEDHEEMFKILKTLVD